MGNVYKAVCGRCTYTASLYTGRGELPVTRTPAVCGRCADIVHLTKVADDPEGVGTYYEKIRDHVRAGDDCPGCGAPVRPITIDIFLAGELECPSCGDCLKCVSRESWQ
jgi:hypothetical protein